MNGSSESDKVCNKTVTLARKSILRRDAFSCFGISFTGY
jgi:hypothetical protein